MDLIEVSHKKTLSTNRHPWELARFQVVTSLISKHIENSNDFIVLDIGCGDIFFVSSLAQKYPLTQFYAVDIAFTEEMISSYRELIKNKNIFLFKSLDEAKAQMKKPANLILLLDVVEHIEQDVEFLRNLKENEAVSEKTNLMITVPAYQRLFCSHDHFLGHYRRYTNKTLLHTIKNSGYKPISIGYFFTVLIFPRFLQVIKEKIKRPDLSKSTTGLVEWNGGKLVTNLFKNVLVFDFKITHFFKKTLGISIPGLSNYVLCKKQ